jgi:hypothetical protein
MYADPGASKYTNVRYAAQTTPLTQVTPLIGRCASCMLAWMRSLFKRALNVNDATFHFVVPA